MTAALLPRCADFSIRARLVRAAMTCVLVSGQTVTTPRLSAQSQKVEPREPTAEASLTAIYRTGQWRYRGPELPAVLLDFTQPSVGARLTISQWPSTYETSILFGAQARTADPRSGQLHLFDVELFGWGGSRLLAEPGRSQLRLTLPLLFGYRALRVSDAPAIVRPIKVARAGGGAGLAWAMRVSRRTTMTAQGGLLLGTSIYGLPYPHVPLHEMLNVIGDAGVAVNWRRLLGWLGLTMSVDYRAQTWSMPAREAFNGEQRLFPFQSRDWSFRIGGSW